MNKIFILILVPLFVFNCSKPKQTVCNDNGHLFSGVGFPIGVAIDPGLLSYDPSYRDIAVKQFNGVTPENIFKPMFLHPLENSFHWADADSLVNFCLTNNKRLHGHTLIWHSQLPYWMPDFNGDANAWELMMKTHIQTIVSHFKGKVRGWDVVNEAFNEDGSLRDNIWHQHMGDAYLEKAFQFAHDADNDVLLFYNDFNLESNTTKRNAVVNYFNRLKTRGVRIDGIGLQMHISIPGVSAPEVIAAFDQLVKNDYRIHVSEFDISLNPSNNGVEPGVKLFEEQADLYGKIILNYSQIPTRYQYGVTFWGIGDGDSWIRNSRPDYPLLYDENYSPKPAYCKLKNIL